MASFQDSKAVVANDRPAVIRFQDRLGHRETFRVEPEGNVAAVLLRHRIPSTSTITLRDGQPVSDLELLEAGATYEVQLIEGYDLGELRRRYEEMLSARPAPGTALSHLQIGLDRGGNLLVERDDLDLESNAVYVENTVAETCSTFSLIEKGTGVLIGLSGGVDSSSLALALAAVRQRLPTHRLAAVTFEDYDNTEAAITRTHGAKLAAELGIEHHTASAELAQEIFHLNRPLREVLPALMETAVAHHVMYIDHHTTRRTLEVFGQRHGLDHICLGLHVTDLIAGLFNGWVTGYEVASIPRRKVGDSTYIYPLAFLSKRHLHLYHLERTGRLAQHTEPNAWERQPLDRNFYYYMSDVLQTFWPGFEVPLFTAHRWRMRRRPAPEFDICSNCGSALLHQPFTGVAEEECDACVVFRKHGFLAT